LSRSDRLYRIIKFSGRFGQSVFEVHGRPFFVSLRGLQEYSTSRHEPR
jgi:hypothetical protein